MTSLSKHIYQAMLFISYSRKDKEIASRLAEMLARNHVDTWMDVLNISKGQLWDDAVQKALTTADTILVILSPDAVNSKNVKDEISFAVSQDKRIIPVIIRKCTVPLQLTRHNHIDLTDISNQADMLLKLGNELDISLAPATSGKVISWIADPGKENFISSLKLVSKKAFPWIAALAAATAVFFLWKNVFGFKGIIYTSPKIEKNAFLSVKFVNTLSGTVKELAVKATLTDTAQVSFGNAAIHFDQIPTNESFMQSAIIIDSREPRVKIIEQPEVYKGTYIVKFPLNKISTTEEVDLDKTALISFEIIPIETMQSTGTVRTKYYNFSCFIYFYPFGAWLILAVLFFCITLVIKKVKE